MNNTNTERRQIEHRYLVVFSDGTETTVPAADKQAAAKKAKLGTGKSGIKVIFELE